MIKNTGKVLYWLFLTFLVLTAGIVAVSSLKIPGNIKFLIVESGSMEPTIKTGSIVLVKPQNNYKVGDIITVYDSANKKVSVTHRILEVKNDTFVTKGDANKSADTEIRHKEDVAGKTILSVPIIGYLIGFAKTQAGLIFLIIVPAAIIIYSEILNIKNNISKLANSRKKNSPKKFLENGLKNFRLNKLLVILPIIGFCLLSIGYSRANYASKVTTGASMTAATWESPINLSFYKDGDNHVGFKITGGELKSYDSLEYLITYDTDQTPQGIMGNKTINGFTEITENGLFLGYCTTGGTCINFTGVDNIKIVVTLKKGLETKNLTSEL